MVVDESFKGNAHRIGRGARMIFTLVEHCHLKKKIKGVGLKVPVLVGEDGSVIVPQDKVMQHEKFGEKCGKQSYDISPQDCESQVNFDEMMEYIEKTYTLDKKMVISVLRDAPSFTIRLLCSQFSINRSVAKLLVAALLKNRAYSKYFSYWRRTKEFTLWLLSKK